MLVVVQAPRLCGSVDAANGRVRLFPPGPDGEPGYFPNSTHPIDAPLEHPNPELPKIPDPPKQTHFSAGFARPPKGWVEPPEPPKAPAEPEVDAVE